MRTRRNSPVRVAETVCDPPGQGPAADARVKQPHEIAAATQDDPTGAAGREQPAALGTALPPAFSDESLALWFARHYAGDLRYVEELGRWFRWSGKVWRADNTLAAFACARAICREAAARCDDRKPSKTEALCSAKTIVAVERLARSDRKLAATAEQWDADPWLLNTPGGVVDLRTGHVRPHRAEDYMTKMTAVAPGGECPLFMNFLTRITAQDSELLGFLQRAFGYSLTGSTREHALLFCYGTGANGKSVLLSTVSGIMANYHRTAPIETFTASSGERHPTDIAGLRGARLVTATETEVGRRWAEAKIKTLTGGDPVSARLMRQDFFDFTPTFKLVIAGNHKPGLRSVDEAIRRRFHLVPFNVTIPKAERDAGLAEKLKAEWPGILRWMLDGCLVWQQRGLDPPDAVRMATGAYLEAEDAIATWLHEMCEQGPSFSAPSTILFSSWKAWAERTGEFIGSQKRLTQALEARGFQLARKNTGSVFTGLQPLPAKDAAGQGWDQ